MTEETTNVIEKIQLPSGNLKPREIENIIKRKIGSATFLSNDYEYEKERVFDFGIEVERHLWDAMDGTFKVRFVPFSQIFQARMKRIDDEYYLLVPKRDQITTRLDSKINGFRIGSESALLKAIGPRLLGIWQIRNQINPLYEIIANVIDDSEVKAERFVRGGRTKAKVDQYLNFLVGIDVLRKEDANYVQGPVIERSLDSKVVHEDVYSEILSTSIQKGHTYMAEFLNFTHITPWIRLGNSNYMPSFYAERRLSMTPEDLGFYHKSIYGNHHANRGNIMARAIEMVQVGVFSKKRNAPGEVFFSGNEEIYCNYSSDLRPRAAQYGVA